MEARIFRVLGVRSSDGFEGTNSVLLYSTLKLASINQLFYKRFWLRCVQFLVNINQCLSKN